MKKTFLCLLCAFFLVAFTSCDDTIPSGNIQDADIPVIGSSSDNTAADKSDSSLTDGEKADGITASSVNNQSPSENTDTNTFSIDSIINIKVIDNGFYSVFTTGSADTPEDNKYGVIDGNGNVVFGPVKDYMFPCNGHRTIGIYSYGKNEYNLPYYLGNGYYITEHGGHGGSDLICYVYHDELERYYAVHQSEGGVYIAQVYAVPDDTAYIVCDDTIKGVKKIEDPYTILAGYIDDMGYWNNTSEEYCFYLSAKDEKMTLSGFEYVAPEYINGYLICKKDGKYGYINGMGEEITGFVFDEARVPFYDKAWVKSDGKWQILDLTRFY